jgi:hypothetical protein
MILFNPPPRPVTNVFAKLIISVSASARNFNASSSKIFLYKPSHAVSNCCK